jgi:Predicted membrane protein
MNAEYYDSLIQGMRNEAGLTGLIAITVTLLSILFVWMLLQEVKWDRIFQYPRRPKARMLQVLLAVVLGNGFAQFLLKYWDYTVLLRGLAE